MTKILLVTGVSGEFDAFIKGLPEGWDCSLGPVSSAAKAFDVVQNERVDVVVVGSELEDSDCLDFAKELMTKFPLLNCAVVSDLPHDDFHEVTEGYGLFMQVEENPGTEEAQRMVKLLESIMGLLNS